MSPRISSFAAVTSAIVLVLGCRSTRSSAPAVVREATNAPDRFLVVEAEGLREPRPGEGCRNPLVDPRSKDRISLVRSSEGTGDYSVPPGSYGVNANELLRVNCATGRSLGIVSTQ